MAALDGFLDRLDPHMCVVTAAVGGERAGCLVGFHSQCSLNPVRYVVWLSDVNHTFRVARSAEVLAVHLLARERYGTAELFGGRTGDETDKFRRTGWREGYGGAAVLDDAEAWFVGRVVERTDGGDHVGHVLEPVEWGGREGAGGALLRLADARTIRPGHPVE
ncbi:flavin reductase family protein [Streptomyces sp. NPDC057245]|uniref:flavin reductase family protein n=1 Tax=Streptomyces TaxID=1883 RepID=UPI001C1E216A|nr:flavin reductase family protein [Streptomyces sp. A108]MBU6535918.1 flavin reductase [Streptomyces sp. A108]